MAAILYRAEELGVITTNQARYLWMQMVRAGYKIHEPIELEADGEQPSLIDELIETYLKDLGYSIADLQEVIPLNEEELRSQYLQDHDKPPLRMIHRA
jgi:Zn-dependent peptidase ImmA (M78 family)